MTGEIKGPQRAFTLTLRMGADTRKDMARHLYHFAQEIETGEFTTGTSGGPTAGAEYELIEIDKPHEKYFEELGVYLDDLRKKREANSPTGGVGE